VGVAPELQQLIFKGEVMENTILLREYEVFNQSNIDMKIALHGGGCLMKWLFCCPCMICCPATVNERC
jgi:hypothetical protein